MRGGEAELGAEVVLPVLMAAGRGKAEIAWLRRGRLDLEGKPVPRREDA